MCCRSRVCVCGRSWVCVWQVQGLCAARLGFGCGRSRALGVAGQGFGCGRSRVFPPATCAGQPAAGLTCHVWRVPSATRGRSTCHVQRLTCHAWRFEIQPFFCFQFVPFFGGVLIIMCSFDMIAPFCPFRASIYFSQLDV